ncbi:hypothetical protein [Lysinibacillus capsici]|uniref:hypothetical protein n=1 Tax=Lysinibacillus capsici TaxID=2115968 RepID=UPI00289F857E|nr:hypothetical protein [Lysinibacillus capsici]
MNKQIIWSISIGFATIAAFNLLINIPTINYIMLGISVFSLLITVSQLFLKFFSNQELIKYKEQLGELVNSDKKAKAYYYSAKIFNFIGNGSIHFSVPISIFSVFIASLLTNDEMISKISNTATLFSMATMLFYIYMSDNN